MTYDLAARPSTPRGCLPLYGFTFVWVGGLLACWWAIGGLQARTAGPTLICLGPLSFMGLLLLVGCAWLALGALGRGLHLTAPAVELSTTALYPGQTLTVTYRQGFKRRVRVADCTVQLVMHDGMVTRRTAATRGLVGDQVVTAFPERDLVCTAGQELVRAYTLDIPETAPPSTFVLSRPRSPHSMSRNLSLTWFVRLRVKIAGWPAIVETYDFEVLDPAQLGGRLPPPPAHAPGTAARGDRRVAGADAGRGGLRLLIVMGGFLLLGVALAIFSATSILSTQQLLSRAITAQGTVTTYHVVEDIGTGRRQQRTATFPVVRFQTAAGETVTFENATSSSPQTIRIGQTVEILYDPSNPHNARINSFGDRWGLSLVVASLAAACLGAAALVYVVFFRRAT